MDTGIIHKLTIAATAAFPIFLLALHSKNGAGANDANRKRTRAKSVIVVSSKEEGIANQEAIVELDGLAFAHLFSVVLLVGQQVERGTRKRADRTRVGWVRFGS